MSVGVYVHVPYCRRRCPYCDFYFEVRPADAAFADAVLAELQGRRTELRSPAGSLSFGGGTPTALPVPALARIVAGVRDGIGLTGDAEISLEANPEDVDDDTARGLFTAGFTRVSVGLQSFDNAVLTFLGRAHDGARGEASVQALVQAGLDVGIDLIIGVPGEGSDRLAADIARARDLGVVHVSTYLLTVEEGTPLQKLVQIGKRAGVDEDAQADAYERAQALLGAAGFRQYEVSSHAVAGHESRHNRLYWAHAPYLGLGPGAHSMQLGADGSVVRRHTTARLDGWLADPTRASADTETLDPAHALREGVAFGLRDLLAGIDLARLAALHHVQDTRAVQAALDAAHARGEVQTDGPRTLLTAHGARFADRVAREVLASADVRR